MTHDGAGRVTTEFSRTYTYDDFHSLVRAGASSGSNAQGFQYDGVGRLIAVRRGTAGWPVEEEVAYDGTQMVAAWDGAQVGTWSATWGQGVDNLVSLKPAPDVPEVMAVKDGRGSVVGYYRGETPTQGLWVTADYTPEGRATQRDWVAGTSCTESGTTQCPRLGGLPFGFHGAYKSPAHGLLYFRNRWYSVEAGQWLTHDPLGEVDSVNLYAFNRFDSVNFVDPFGLEGKGAATATVICHDPEGYTCGPKGKAAREKDLLKASQDTERHSQSPARVAATALVGIAVSTSGGVGAGAVSRVPKNGVAIAVAAGIGAGVLACHAGASVQCQSNLKGIEKEGGRLAEAVRKEVIREIAAVIAAIAEGVKGQGEENAATPEPATPSDPTSESEEKEVDWESFPPFGETPKGHPHTEHTAGNSTTGEIGRAEERGFSDEAIDTIVEENEGIEKEDDQGRITHMHTDARGNTVVLNVAGEIVTVFGQGPGDSYRR